MKHGNQIKLANLVDVHPTLINKILKGKARPSYDIAKKLTQFVEGTDPIMWMELDLVLINKALETWSPNNDG